MGWAMRPALILLVATGLAGCTDAATEASDDEDTGTGATAGGLTTGMTAASPGSSGSEGDHGSTGPGVGSESGPGGASESGEPPDTTGAQDVDTGSTADTGAATSTGGTGTAADTDPGTETDTDTDTDTDGETQGETQGDTDSGTTGSAGTGTTAGGTTDGGTTDGGTTDGGTTDGGTTGPGGTDPGTTSFGDTITASSDGGESGETGTGSTGGGTGPASCDDGSAGTSAPCNATIALGHTDTPQVGVGDQRVVTVGPEGNAIVRDGDSLAIVYTLGGVDQAELAGDRLLTLEGPTAVLRDATDGAVVLAFDPADARGLSDDGSYVWTADDTALTLLDADGAPLWSDADDYTDASVLALPGFVHVHAAGATGSTIRSVDLTTFGEGSVGFAGSFAFFFSDRPRFVTEQGEATRVYDTDGSILFFDLAPVSYGRGDWIVLGAALVNLSDTGTPVHTLGPGWRAADDLIAYRGCPSGEVVTLGPVDITVDDFDVGNCDGSAMAFDADPGGWLAAIDPGRIHDHLGNALDTGGPLEVEAGLGGRIVVRTATGTDVYDHLGSCEVAATASLPTQYDAVDLAADGSAMIGRQHLQHIDMVSLPDGGVLGTWCHPASCSGPSTQLWGAVAINDDASLVSIHSNWTGAISANVYRMPGEEVVISTFGFWSTPLGLPPMVPFAPCGDWAIESDMSSFTDDPIEHTALGYVHQDGVFAAAVVEGLTFGFLDAQRVLVGRYEDNTGQCGGLVQSCFTHSEIVGMDATIVQETTLPETRNFHRITASEILVEDPARIYDVYTSEQLWSDAGAEMARPAGPDHVVVLDGGELRIETWRP